ncbi:TetR/AcrR family transcriptional regulator [Streptomyces sp. NA02950]|uniref:TetR/AcrR family transcriptional regulator n=1 Tax=Streptomyces sp. NA02950 TaxID=2742137 RepID=UPI0015904B58|nr:TetR/AcrR family transcriptional regulator [Streptomyces sp. NA02950]QKV95291.1 TetR/AcrR family transcriptional regulator [Streptomyces sp. NA02950]
MAEKAVPDATRRSQRSHRAILDAAIELVGEMGYAKLTIEAIAARAGVGKQTIYRWWPSKAAVLLDAFVALGEQAAREAGGDGAGGEETYEIPDTGDLEADLKLVVRATVDELNAPEYDAPLRALAAESVINAEVGAEFVRRVLEPQLQLYVKRLRAAQDAGQVDPAIDPRIALELIVGPLAHRWLLRTLPLSHEYGDAVVAMVLRGITVR